MLARLVTAAVGIPLILAALYVGGGVWLALMLLVCIFGTAESVRLTARSGLLPFHAVSQALACGFVIQAYAWSGDDPGRWSVPVSALMGALGAVVALHALWPRVERQGFPGIGATLATAIYPGVFVAHLVALRGLGLFPVLLALVCTWATDTAAFFTGSLLGRRPLWRAVSPNKTVEGAAGGLLAGALAAGLVGVGFGFAFWPWAAIGAAASCAAQLGDLVESGLKRRAGVKDSGGLLPGHGGVLDRMDSLFFAGAIVYYLHGLVG